MQLYLYRMFDTPTGEAFLKIGVSQNAATRFAFGTMPVRGSDLPLAEKVKRMMAGQTHISDHPYETTLLHVVEFELEGFAWEAEDTLLATLRATDASYKPRKHFPGDSECFVCEESVTILIVKWMTEQAQAAPKGADLLRYKLAEIGIRDDKPLAKHRKVIAKLKA